MLDNNITYLQVVAGVIGVIVVMRFLVGIDDIEKFIRTIWNDKLEWGGTVDRVVQIGLTGFVSLVTLYLWVTGFNAFSFIFGWQNGVMSMIMIAAGLSMQIFVRRTSARNKREREAEMIHK